MYIDPEMLCRIAFHVLPICWAIILGNLIPVNVAKNNKAALVILGFVLGAWGLSCIGIGTFDGIEKGMKQSEVPQKQGTTNAD